MLQKLCDVVRKAGQIVLSARDVEHSVREKTSPRDLVTKYDLLVQNYLRKELLALLPDAGFLGEEGDICEDDPKREWLFIVDPIDGTTNFVQGYHNSCVSVGLAHFGRMEYGVVYNPYDGELYAAKRGEGASLNGRPILPESFFVKRTASSQLTRVTGAPSFFRADGLLPITACQSSWDTGSVPSAKPS